MVSEDGEATGAPDGQSVAEMLNASGRGALAETMGIQIVSATADEVIATMPVTGNTQPFGLLHGGASVVLAETVGSIASALHGQGRIPVGIEINATHHRAATAGTVTAVATPLSRGRTLATYEVAITDDSGRRICTSRITCLLRDPEPNR